MWLRAILVLFVLSLSRAGLAEDQAMIYTFDYPPFTVESSRDGVIDLKLSHLFSAGGIEFTVLYRPVARALWAFSSNKNTLFAGNIGQFSDEVQSDLDYYVLAVVEIAAMVGIGNQHQSLRGARFVGLRGDKNMVRIANRFEGSVHEVSSNEQAAKLVARGRADVFVCVVEECESLPDRKELIRNVNFNEILELQLVYHKQSQGAEIIERLQRTPTNTSDHALSLHEK